MSTQTTQKIKDQFIELVLALEPERLQQDGEASDEEIQFSLKNIKNKWETLQNKYQVNVTLDMAEQWAWE